MCTVPQNIDESKSSYSIYKDCLACRKVKAKICLAYEHQATTYIRDLQSNPYNARNPRGFKIKT